MAGRVFRSLSHCRTIETGMQLFVTVLNFQFFSPGKNDKKIKIKYFAFILLPLLFVLDSSAEFHLVFQQSVNIVQK